MWKSQVFKAAYRLSAYVRPLRIGKFRIVRSFKKRGEQLAVRFLTHENRLLARINGFPTYIYANSADTRAYLGRPFEPFTTELFTRSVKPGATVIDVGAQFGYFSLIAAKQVGPAGQVYAFEPVPANFQLLKQNIAMNEYPDIIHPVPKAIGDKDTMVTMFVYEGSDSHAMYRHPQAFVRETVSVECITLDDFLLGEPVDVVKIDIEGNEPNALEGMKRTIVRSDPLILFAEFAPECLRRAGVEPNDYLNQLSNLGFEVQLIDEDSRCLRAVAEVSIPDDDPAWYANLYCTKRNTKGVTRQTA